MIKDFITHDNVLSNPDSLIKLSKQITYQKNRLLSDYFSDIPIKSNSNNSANHYWCGFRSDPLDVIDYNLFIYTFNEIFNCIFSGLVYSQFSYVVESYLHFLPHDCYCSDFDLHRDSTTFSNNNNTNNVLLAGVIYLNVKPEKNSGTIIQLQQNKKHIVNNKFNRLVLYNSNIPHRPQNGFGNNLNDSRLTLTFFIKEFTLKA